MIRPISYSVCVSVNIAILLLMCNRLFAQGVMFDCPAHCPAALVEANPSGKIIEVIVPVSSTVSDSKLELQELRVDVFWNRNAYPLVDYGPKTALQSDIDGPIAIESSRETSYKIGAEISTSLIESVTPSVEAGISRKNAETRRYHEIPQQELLLASGTTKRGTGAFYQFKPSRTATLEGGRELVVAFQVPETWRAGVLQVELRASGKRKLLSVFNESFEHARAFVVPVYLAGDNEARQFASEFSRSEQRLRQDWQQHRGESSHSAAASFSRMFSGGDEVPELWVHQLIQSGKDMSIDRVESRLPKQVSIAANEFVQARENLLQLSR